MSSQDVVQSLRRLNLNECLEEDIFDWYGAIGQVGNIIANYYPGIGDSPPNCFVRATVYDPSIEQITTVSRLSYPPLRFNTSYQRASTPCQPMFYATRVRDFEDANVLNANATCLRETTTDRTRLCQEGKRVALSLWYTMEPLDLLAIFSWAEFQRNNKEMREVNEAFKQFISTTAVHVRDNTKILYDYLGERFAIPVDSNQADYMPSAVFVKFILLSFRFKLNRGLHGVVFPSTKVAGSELNVALVPRIVDRVLKCAKILDCQFNLDGSVQAQKGGTVDGSGIIHFNESVNIRIES